MILPYKHDKNTDARKPRASGDDPVNGRYIQVPKL